jgi:Cu-processing system permease protein
MTVELSLILTIAAKEARDRVRNRWVLVVASVFTLFALVIAYFGSAGQGAVGVRSIEVTLASLVSLVIYLIPLIALILGFDTVVGERERGSLNLLLSMPVTRGEVLLGKYLGLAAALTGSTVAGFGLAGIVMASELEPSALGPYMAFLASSVLLGLAFLSLSVLISTYATDRARASGIAIGVWLFFVLVFDLLLLGGLVVAGGGVLGELVPYLLLLNPADIFRILNIASFDEVRTLYGLATVFPDALDSPVLLTSLLIIWIVAPVALASWRFRR